MLVNPEGSSNAATPAVSGVQLAEVVASIAIATDLGLGLPLDHVLRSCVIASRFADRLGVEREDADATYWVTLFLAAGCTGVSYEMSLLFGDDIAFRTGSFDALSKAAQMKYVLARAGGDGGLAHRTKVRAQLVATKAHVLEQSFIGHCRVSAGLAARLGLGDRVATSLVQTFEACDGKGIPDGVSGDEIGLPIRIANIVNMAEIHDRRNGPDAAVAVVRALSGPLDPALVDAWCADGPALLEGVDAESSWQQVLAMEPAGRGPLSERELDEALEALADYADLKSPWFSGHSRGVASLAVAAGTEMGLPAADLVALRRAALVHDLGRNGVPNQIWDKAGPLTEAELERVRLHSYYTDRVLRRAGGLATIAAVASAAHERDDASGYPRGIGGATVPLLGRLLAAADAYHAMLEDRPHRRALSREAARDELRRAATAGTLTGAAVDAVLAAAGHRTRRKPSNPAGLTTREVEVLGLAAKGLTTRAVAHELGITPKTAGNHIERIYTKIGASTRAEAAMFAMRHGLVADWETEPA